MFIDKVKIYIKAGDGGDGAATFRREKYVDMGGPDGGDGGDGGSVIFVADPNVNTLLDYKYKKHYKAQGGGKGQKKNKHGKNGENLYLKVPVGTVIREAETLGVIADLIEPGQQAVVAKGGRGGRGNARFATSTRQAPKIAEPGELGEELEVILELKVLADVGLVGFPNVGKSTLLSVVTSAQPKIGNYHFTTLHPNLGVVKVKDKSFVLADIPGLIEGAHQGAGLGLQFLRHIERTRMLVHVVDISGSEQRDPYKDFLTINNELLQYNERFALLPQVVAANKIDLVEDVEKTLKDFREKIGDKYKVFPISAATKEGVEDLFNYLAAQLDVIPKVQLFKAEDFKIYKPKEEEEFTITKDGDIFVIEGKKVEKLLRMTNFDNYDSLLRFQRILKKSGIEEALRQKGVKEGDTVRILNLEFEVKW
ncbi:GTP-binding protein [Anaerobranca californiensis DSM 14826]|jgi:GTP-binding protein|uniref:GTPase Obg n=1 Tax=Anaerobranca californiensis DSM 14826 TaxID=1120989 RepID=A0A1M6NHJ4_9FIRM|nr:GTPase ObgE [Anaerobranca californiensis]SHJ95170.1 GTP-binding protein [Anaerobranca californiensis DSM 14826]